MHPRPSPNALSPTLCVYILLRFYENKQNYITVRGDCGGEVWMVRCDLPRTYRTVGLLMIWCEGEGLVALSRSRL